MGKNTLGCRMITVICKLKGGFTIVDAAAEVERAQRVALLHSATRLDDSAVNLAVVEQHRRLAIAPLGPARQPWEHLAHSGDEVLALDQVEGVLEVDLEQSELRVLALADDITQGYTLGSRWLWGTQEWIATSTPAGAAAWIATGTTIPGGDSIMVDWYDGAKT